MSEWRFIPYCAITPRDHIRLLVREIDSPPYSIHRLPLSASPTQARPVRCHCNTSKTTLPSPRLQGTSKLLRSSHDQRIKPRF
jgi:hypothetical protein